MKISDLDDADQLVTKAYLENVLDAKLEKLKSELLMQLIASERGQRAWIAGLYALLIASDIALGSILFGIAQHLKP
jgi:hypothetical protein